MEQRVTFDDGPSTTLESWGTRGPALLCVHGMTSSRKAWTRLGERFAGTFRVFAYDQRGHGDAADITGPMTLARGVRDLEAVAAHVDGDLAALIGHSWGGAIVILAGVTSRAHAIIAIDPVLRVLPGTWRADYLDDAERDFAEPLDELEKDLRQRLADWPAVDVDAKMHAVRHMTAEPIARLATDNKVDEGGWNILAQTAAYPKPLLVFAAGTADSVMTADDVRELKSLGGANLFIRNYPEQGHNLHRTAFDRFSKDVERLLTR